MSGNLSALFVWFVWPGDTNRKTGWSERGVSSSPGLQHIAKQKSRDKQRAERVSLILFELKQVCCWSIRNYTVKGTLLIDNVIRDGSDL